MTSEEYQSRISTLAKAINRNARVRRTATKPMRQGDEQALHARSTQLPGTLAPFYAYRDGFLVKWNEKEGEDPDVFGSINIRPLADLFDGLLVELDPSVGYVINANHAQPISPTGVFRPLDFFVDEACVGFFSDYGSKDELYYHDFGISFYSLKTDFAGYVTLLAHSYGYAYWQQVILNHEYGYRTDAAGRFKEDMPRLFPDFDYQAFIALYESVKRV